MRIGLSFDLKEKIASSEVNLPEDAFEEYDYPSTVNFIASALASAGHNIIRLGGGKEFLENILREQVDIVFNISEGRGTYRSREAQVPAVLEMLNIPYSGSDPECLAVCLDKPLTKKLLSIEGIHTPPWWVIRDLSELDTFIWSNVTFPAIIKPVFEGSSKGVRLNSVVSNSDEAITVSRNVLDLYKQPVMVEGFINGDEVTVGILGNSPPLIVGIMRILPRKKTDRFVYSLEVKRDWQALVDYECPAKLSTKTLADISSASLKIFKMLECRDFARVDFRIGPDGIPYFIEINPLPGLGDYSDLIIMAIKMGWSHDIFIRDVMNTAIKRCSICQK
jgi:D-alanine-D-alanine ligase